MFAWFAMYWLQLHYSKKQSNSRLFWCTFVLLCHTLTSLFAEEEGKGDNGYHVTVNCSNGQQRHRSPCYFGSLITKREKQQSAINIKPGLCRKLMKRTLGFMFCSVIFTTTMQNSESLSRNQPAFRLRNHPVFRLRLLNQPLYPDL